MDNSVELSKYIILPKNKWFSVYRRKRILVLVSSNFTDRIDAEELVGDLASGRITEREARSISVTENYRLRPI